MTSRRDVGEEVIEAAAREALEAPAPTPAPSHAPNHAPNPASRPASRKSKAGGSVASAQPAPPLLNPVGIYKRSGEAALSTALSTQELPALRALVAEHNLDPSGETEALDRDALAAHVVVQAKRRAERDEKMFDY